MASTNTSLFFIRISSWRFWISYGKYEIDPAERESTERLTKSTVTVFRNELNEVWTWMKSRETENVLFWNLRSKKSKVHDLKHGEDEELEKPVQETEQWQKDSGYHCRQYTSLTGYDSGQGAGEAGRICRIGRLSQDHRI